MFPLSTSKNGDTRKEPDVKKSADHTQSLSDAIAAEEAASSAPAPTLAGPEGDGWSHANPVENSVWWKPSPHTSIQGLLLGRFQRRAGKRTFYYQVAVTQTTHGWRGKADAGEIVILEEGEIINVDEREGLKDLAALCGGEVVREVFVLAKEKVKTKNGNSCWTFDIRSRAATR